MAMINILAISLLIAASSSLLIAIYCYFSATKRKTDELAVPIFVFGVFDSVSGLFLELTWPLPGPYNILFGDPMLFLGILMIVGGALLYRKSAPKVLAPIASLFGLYLLAEAYSVLMLGLTLSPMLTTALYGSSGLAAALSIGHLSRDDAFKKQLYLLAAVLLAITTLILLFYSYGAVMGHIASLATH